VREIDDLREAAQLSSMEVRMNSIVLHSSVPPDNEHRLIINAILFANLAQMIIFFYSVFEQCIAYLFCRQHVVVAHDVFKLLSFLLVASVINSVGVKPMAELCREYGISRKTGYKIFDRYQACGVQGLTDRNRRPYRYAHQLPFQVENFILNVSLLVPTGLCTSPFRARKRPRRFHS